MSLLPFGGAAAAGPDPFTVVPDLATADGKAANSASQGDKPGVPFEGVLADAIHSPKDPVQSREAEGHAADGASEKAQRERPTADRESGRHDLTGLLLGAVNAKLRDEDQPQRDLSPAHLKASGVDGKGHDLAPHLRQPVGDFTPRHLHDTGAVEGKGHDLAAKLVDGLPLAGTGSAESQKDGLYRISLPRDLIQGTDQPKGDGLSLTDTAFKNVGESAPIASADRLEAQPVDPSKLHPELRTRLQRVIERMQAEFGYDVKIAEGYRTPERQAQLYAQGRTMPGAVVTWTQDSAHTQGLAADVIIDGSYDNPTAYQRFAQIAQQEGLRSLAPLDPGHVELDAEAFGLPRTGSTVQVTSVQGGVARPADVAQVTPVADVSRPAVVAQVAAVAAPDQIARVATPGHDLAPASAEIAELIGGDGNPDGARPADLRPRPSEGAGFSTEVMPDRQVAAMEQQAARERRYAEAMLAEPTAEAGPFSDPAPRPLHSALTPSSETVLQTASFPRVDAPVAGVEAMERAERVRELLAAQRRPVQQMTLAVDAGTAEEALMKVSLRDGRVSTSIGVRDPFAAERLAAESAALRASLTRQGVEPGSIDVRAILPTLDSDAGFSTRRDGQQSFTPGLGEQLDGNAREDADSNTRSRSYWESLNKDRDQLFGTRGGNR